LKKLYSQVKRFSQPVVQESVALVAVTSSFFFRGPQLAKLSSPPLPPARVPRISRLSGTGSLFKSRAPSLPPDGKFFSLAFSVRRRSWMLSLFISGSLQHQHITFRLAWRQFPIVCEFPPLYSFFSGPCFCFLLLRWFFTNPPVKLCLFAARFHDSTSL